MKHKAVNWKHVVVGYLFERDNELCQLCNKRITEDDLLEVDHIVERQNGGTDNIDNLRLVHLVCHKRRHQKTRTSVRPKIHEVPIVSTKPTYTTMKGLRENYITATEKPTILAALKLHNNNVTQTAKALGLSRKGLQLKMIKYNLRK